MSADPTMDLIRVFQELDAEYERAEAAGPPPTEQERQARAEDAWERMDHAMLTACGFRGTHYAWLRKELVPELVGACAWLVREIEDEHPGGARGCSACAAVRAARAAIAKAEGRQA